MLLDISGNNGVTVFVSSHILGEISRFASRIGIIHEGLLIQELETAEIEKRCKRSLVIRTEKPENAIKFLSEKGIQAVLDKDQNIIVNDIKATNDPAAIAGMLVYAGFSPSMLKTDEEDLESYFFRTIGMKGGLL